MQHRHTPGGFSCSSPQLPSVHMRRASDTHPEDARAQRATRVSRALLFSTGWLQYQSKPKEQHRRSQRTWRNVNNKPETCKPSLSNTSQKHHEGHYGFYTVLFKTAECTDGWQLSDSFKCSNFQRQSPDEWLVRSLCLVWFDSKRIRS